MKKIKDQLWCAAGSPAVWTADYLIALSGVYVWALYAFGAFDVHRILAIAFSTSLISAASSAYVVIASDGIAVNIKTRANIMEMAFPNKCFAFFIFAFSFLVCITKYRYCHGMIFGCIWFYNHIISKEFL